MSSREGDRQERQSLRKRCVGKRSREGELGLVMQATSCLSLILTVPSDADRRGKSSRVAMGYDAVSSVILGPLGLSSAAKSRVDVSFAQGLSVTLVSPAEARFCLILFCTGVYLQLLDPS